MRLCGIKAGGILSAVDRQHITAWSGATIVFVDFGGKQSLLSSVASRFHKSNEIVVDSFTLTENETYTFPLIHIRQHTTQTHTHIHIYIQTLPFQLMSHSGGGSITNDDEQQQQQPTLTAPGQEDTPMSVVQHNPGSPGPLTPTSNFGADGEHHDFGGEEGGADNVNAGVGEGEQEDEQHQEERHVHEQDMVVDLFFQKHCFLPQSLPLQSLG